MHLYPSICPVRGWMYHGGAVYTMYRLSVDTTLSDVKIGIYASTHTNNLTSSSPARDWSSPQWMHYQNGFGLGRSYPHIVQHRQYVFRVDMSLFMVVFCEGVRAAPWIHDQWVLGLRASPSRKPSSCVCSHDRNTSEPVVKLLTNGHHCCLLRLPARPP